MSPPHTESTPVTVNMPPSDPSVAVTLGEIYKLVLETRDTTRDTKTAVEALTVSADDHEARIRSLERKVWVSAGVAAVGGAGLWQGLATAFGG